MEGERELCIQAGMDDYLTKPIRLEELSGALTRVVRRPDAPHPAASVDPEVIRKLVSSFGAQGPGSVSALIDTFLDHLPEQTSSLSSAVERGAFEEVRREAHTLKSNAASFGAHRLEGLSRELEAAAKARTPDGQAGLVDRIREELTDVTRELGAIREEL
jgi:HPt (histidine-containing phosphotransfer) domain-containing protein